MRKKLSDKNEHQYCIICTSHLSDNVYTWYTAAVLVPPGIIVNRTYGLHKNLYIIALFLLTTAFGPIQYGPP